MFEIYTVSLLAIFLSKQPCGFALKTVSPMSEAMTKTNIMSQWIFGAVGKRLILKMLNQWALIQTKFIAAFILPMISKVFSAVLHRIILFLMARNTM